MGLKQDIVVVSEFSVKNAKGKGTRGSTPGDYVTRYMARTGAVEDLAPIKMDNNDTYVQRYMLRKSAVEVCDFPSQIEGSLEEVDGQGGVAFGRDGNDDIPDISMSHNKVEDISNHIQELFEDGKTAIKTVLSFDGDYLKRVGIVEDDFECKHRGDYRGNIDQMKLRSAIMHGVDRMKSQFDDLVWIGVIQVDTKHVHCHLCMVDAGDKKRMLPNGEQRGKLNETDKRYLRRGVDMALDGVGKIRMMASNVNKDRADTKCFIKKFTHALIVERGTPQFLLACLPDNKKWWRASTNREAMKKANAITREYVEEILKLPDSGYDVAMKEIEAYAHERCRREELGVKDYRRFVSDGRERMVLECMNGVYNILSQVVEDEYQVQTPLMDVMSMNYTDMAYERDSDPMIEFGFKLRSYSSRLSHHMKERRKYHQAIKDYDMAASSSNVDPASVAVRNFYEVEEMYNAMLVAKYRHFLAFLPADDDEIYEDFKELIDYRTKLHDVHSMLNDNAWKRFKSDDSAEKYGEAVYNQHGGAYMRSDPKVIEGRFKNMTNTYQQKVADFQVKLDELGMSYGLEADKAKVVNESKYGFDEVKAIDLHHLGYDFPFDADVSKINFDNFKKMANYRYDSFQKAKQYLVASDQEDLVDLFEVRDIEFMKEFADNFVDDTSVVLTSRKGEGGKRHNGKTTSLDLPLDKNIKEMVKSVVQTVDVLDKDVGKEF